MPPPYKKLIFDLNIQSQFCGLEPGADVFGAGDDGSRQHGADLDGLAQGLAVGQTDGDTRAEGIAGASGVLDLDIPGGAVAVAREIIMNCLYLSHICSSEGFYADKIYF